MPRSPQRMTPGTSAKVNTADTFVTIPSLGSVSRSRVCITVLSHLLVGRPALGRRWEFTP